MKQTINAKTNINHIMPLLQEIKNILKENKENKENKEFLKNENLKLQEYPNIKGLYFCENIISENEENNILNKANQQIWLNDLSRRVQHYGYKYNYKSRKINKNDYLGVLPDWTNNMVNIIFSLIKNKNINLPYQKFDQLIINEYKTGQSIGPHIDCEPCFKDGIVTVTMGCSGIMTFTHKKTKVSHDVKLKRRSVAIMTGESRYDWTHEINKYKNKNFTNHNPRVSFTFRKCIL
jgi:alkylated DNA repair dioxygenase AlkB